MLLKRNICLICKGGKALCGQKFCPILEQNRLKEPINKKLKEHMFGPSPPSLFIGRWEYPNVFVGPMSSLEDENVQLMDDPSKWQDLGFSDIIKMRSMLVRSKTKENIKNVDSRIVRDMQELTLSIKSTDIEIKFKKKPRYAMTFSKYNHPIGPSAMLEKFKITENVKIPNKVDKVVNDELKSNEMLQTLYKKGFDVYYLSKVLSSGITGLDKKMVPTRWSITAIDDMIGKYLIEKIKDYPLIDSYYVYSNTYLENHFEILLIPGKWSFEQFEAWAPKTLWTPKNQKPVIVEEHEMYTGRKKYAKLEGGGYYAGRLGVVEHLAKIKRQATAIIFREIYDTYIIPVGVFEVRENARQALSNKPGKFTTLDAALNDIKTRLINPLSEYKKNSVLLQQRKIFDFYKG